MERKNKGFFKRLFGENAMDRAAKAENEGLQSPTEKEYGLCADTHNQSAAETCQEEPIEIKSRTTMIKGEEFNQLASRVLYQKRVKKIRFSTEPFPGAESITVTYDISKNQDGSLKTWRRMIDSDFNYEVIISTGSKNVGIEFNEDSSRMFRDFEALESVSFGPEGLIDYSKVESIEYLFYGCKSLKKLDLSMMVLPSLSWAERAFCECRALEELSLFRVPKETPLENINNLFSVCFHLAAIDISELGDTKVSSIKGLVANCYSLKYLNMGHMIGSYYYDPVKTPREDYTDFFARCGNLEVLVTDSKYVKARYNNPGPEIIEYQNKNGITRRVYSADEWNALKDKDDILSHLGVL